MPWFPWRRLRRGACWHDLVTPEDAHAGELAEEARTEVQRLAEVMNEPTAVYRGLRVPPWLVFTSAEDEW